jgi:hypothetical protein
VERLSEDSVREKHVAWGEKMREVWDMGQDICEVSFFFWQC